MTRGSQLLSSPWHHAWKPDKHVPSASRGLYGSEKDLILNFFAGRNNANPGDEEQNRGLAPNGQRMEPQLPNGREGSEPLTNGQGMVDTAC